MLPIIPDSIALFSVSQFRSVLFCFKTTCLCSVCDMSVCLHSALLRSAYTISHAISYTFWIIQLWINDEMFEFFFLYLSPHFPYSVSYIRFLRLASVCKRLGNLKVSFWGNSKTHHITSVSVIVSVSEWWILNLYKICEQMSFSVHCKCKYTQAIGVQISRELIHRPLNYVYFVIALDVAMWFKIDFPGKLLLTFAAFAFPKFR